MTDGDAQRWVREPAKEVVAAHLVNLAWNGLSMLEKSPVMPDADEPG